MGYQLGVDLGTTYSAAAIGRNGRVEVATLGTANPVMPSVVLLRADGEVLVGEVAMRRGLAEPTRVAREFKRRLGDPTPLVLGGTPYGAEALMGHMLRAIVTTVAEREGEQPERVVLTHPANFGPYKLEQMREVARLGGLDLDKVAFLTEPQAAAISYASRNRVEPGEVVAIYDFGGGTFDAALVRRTDDGFELIGRPEGMERFGGIDIDAALIAHVDQSLDGALSTLEPSDPEVQAAVARLRDDCQSAKEALSGDTDTSIAVTMPGLQTHVRLTRAELEDMVRPRLVETVEALERAVRSAGLTMDQVSRILLVGGSSRMPIVAELIRQRTGRPISVDAHPKFAIALGAAGQDSPAFGSASSAPASPPPPVPVPPPVPAGAGQVTPPPLGLTPAPSAPVSSAPDRSKLYVIAGVAAAVVLAVIGFVVFAGGDDDPPSSDDTEETDPDDTTDETARTTTEETSGTSAPLGSIPITPAEFEAALLNLDDMQDGFSQASTIDTGQDICGEVPVHAPRYERVMAYEKNQGTDDLLFVVNEVRYYASTKEADEVLEQRISLVQNCTDQQTETINGAEFSVLMAVSRMADVELEDYSPIGTCTSGAKETFTYFSTDGSLFSTDAAVLRCANVITVISVQVGPEVTFDDLFVLRDEALKRSVEHVSRLQLIP